eukprot:COSAG01_NODE_546_length_15649_cov_21.047395_9_plen_173_part_00
MRSGHEPATAERPKTGTVPPTPAAAARAATAATGATPAPPTAAPAPPAASTAPAAAAAPGEERGGEPDAPPRTGASMCAGQQLIYEDRARGGELVDVVLVTERGTHKEAPPEKAIAFFGILYLGGPLHEGGINDGRCGTASRDQSIPEQTHFFIVRPAWIILPILWTSPLIT